jgi:hypothetical protein
MDIFANTNKNITDSQTKQGLNPNELGSFYTVHFNSLEIGVGLAAPLPPNP